MARGLFGRRKESQPLEEATNWPQLPGALERPRAQGLDPPAVAYAMANASGVPAPTPETETELLERIVAFRGSVADSLFATSKDYQILCNLTRENLQACDETIDELRRRLAGNLHYAVLAKLDELHALVKAKIRREARQSDPTT
jgi:hypothetical protein